ncbi:Scr1 family TA system antitoxin-like transcriptional regulator [Streptomyces sp. CSDS2]|uniref:Scr1 family TA system antitoxin-like transcriptional regulator n=1 Tax=Streptomyces sp. CSDS2 TaxID=3055051 RepID=UPI0025AF45F8|nr:Scr1 family TA system antitoxin-like transcriptional regulator [Streptomyces sp. CSDS2]MDN3260810.1 Scr1 family TA system antitoxin-like transcriptional regulator [Streptomyces sp. CSDS2]
MKPPARPSRVVEAGSGTGLLHPVAPVTADSAAPIEIVLGVYLRALRLALGRSLTDAARSGRMSRSALSRLERMEIPLSVRTLGSLLQSYGVEARDVQYLSQYLPPDVHGARHLTALQRRAEGESEPGNLARRGRWDMWVDVAGDEAVARYAAVTWAASESVQYTMSRIPPGFRTPAYQAAITDPGRCLESDEPAEVPFWLAHATRNPFQRQVLLLDDTVLDRPVGTPEVMAEQLRHLLGLMGGRPGYRPVTIRVLPHAAPNDEAFQLAGEVGLLTVYGHWLIAGMNLAPWYEARSGYAHAVRDSLHRAVQQADDGRRSYDLIRQAADRWAHKAAP